MAEQAAAQAVIDAVGQITFGSESSFENLSVVPLLCAKERDADYVTLDEALARKWAQITEGERRRTGLGIEDRREWDRAGLAARRRRADRSEQNRVVNLTILARPQSTTEIPVSCVESGRWHHVSRGFTSAPRAQYAEGRAAKMRQVTSSLRSGSRASNQSEVWNLLAAKSARLNATSDTAAMSAVFEKLETPIDAFVAAFSPVDHQVGAMFLHQWRAGGAGVVRFGEHLA